MKVKPPPGGYRRTACAYEAELALHQVLQMRNTRIRGHGHDDRWVSLHQQLSAESKKIRSATSG